MKIVSLTCKIIYISIFFCFQFTNAVHSQTSKNYQIECISLETDGYVKLALWDTKLGEKYKPEQASKDAIYAILFAGVSGKSGCSLSPLLSNTKEKENFKNIEKSFFSRNGIWKNFTRSSVQGTNQNFEAQEKKWMIVQIYVSKSELRKHLEDQKIIKRLNDGF
jgi:hypothetical protein